MPPSDLEAILVRPADIIKPPAQVAVGIPADLLRRRPDIRAAEFQAAAQSARIGVALSDLYPSFTSTGSVGVQAEDVGNLFKGGSLTGFVGPAFRWNLFNYGRIRNNVRVQDARFQQLIVNYQNAVLSAYQEVENALIAFLRSQQQADVLAQGVNASQRSVDLALIQYRDGAADYTRVLNTQQSLVTAQDRLTETRGDIVRNLVGLYKALGGVGNFVKAKTSSLKAPCRRCDNGPIGEIRYRRKSRAPSSIHRYPPRSSHCSDSTSGSHNSLP